MSNNKALHLLFSTIFLLVVFYFPLVLRFVDYIAF